MNRSVTSGAPPVREASDAPIRWLLNGEVVESRCANSTRTLLDELRLSHRLTGTKEGCAEGDCGACTVVVGELRDNELRLATMNACLAFLPTMEGRAVFTVEYLTRNSSAPHPVQRAMVDCHGSQCGFCTPGFVMSLWAQYNRHLERGTRPDRAAVLDEISGNLCRCTGYRPIVEAGLRAYDANAVPFSRDAIEAGLRDLASMSSTEEYHRGAEPVQTDAEAFLAPTRLERLLALVAARPEATLLAGGTDIGLWVNKDFRDLGTVIWLGHVAELTTIARSEHEWQIGAAVTLSTLHETLSPMYPELDTHWRRFASVPIRNVATIGGNIANGSPIGDSMPWLMALDACIELRSTRGTRRLSLEDFYLGYQQNDRRADEVLTRVLLPSRSPDWRFRCYKLAKRFDSDISAVYGAFRIRLEQNRVREVRVAYGGMAAMVQRASAVESVIQDALWEEATVARAMQALDQDFEPMSDQRASARYRRTAAANLLYRFYLETRTTAPLLPQHVDVFAYADTARAVRDAGAAHHASGTSVSGSSVPHESALPHVTGDARYVDDHPVPDGTLHVALGLSEHAHAHLRGVDLTRVRAYPGVVAVFTAGDIPGENDCGPILADDPVLADDRVQFVGQPIFAVIARSMRAARAASRLAEVDYEPLPAILDARKAIELGSVVVEPLSLTRGSPDDALDKAARRRRGQWRVGGQEHFYLEGQVTLATPQEDRGLSILCSTQHPTEMQHLVARLLGLEAHRVQVETRRMGGGFGGKESQSALFCCVAALAAWKLGRPIKLRLDRDDDMHATGKRHPFHYDYDIGFDDTGRIAALKLRMIADAGFSADLSAPVATRALCHVDNAYFLEHVAIEVYCARTNKQSNTAFRGFGGPQGAILIEYLIDEIARELDLDPLVVRQRNFYDKAGRDTTPYGQRVEGNVLEPLIEELVASSAYHDRREEVRRFNCDSPVLRRGIALTPVKFGISFNVVHFNQAGALVHVYTDGSVLVNHGGTEMGQGLHTKVAQVVAAVFGIHPERVRATATDTSKVPNTSATAASTGADLNGKAAEEAALVIRRRLAELAAQSLQASAEQVVFENAEARFGDRALPFDRLVQLAYEARIQLWSDGFYATPDLHWNKETLTGSPFFYFAYGAAVSEVVIDRLTGEWRLLRTDLLHDAGTPLNADIDIGQVEGGFVQGMGWLTLEELCWSDEGRLLTHAPSTYKIPASNDCPSSLVTRLYPNPNPKDTIGRSKAVGEPPLLLAFSVLLAIRDAVASLGEGRASPALLAPATPESILAAIESVRSGRPTGDSTQSSERARGVGSLEPAGPSNRAS